MSRCSFFTCTSSRCAIAASICRNYDRGHPTQLTWTALPHPVGGLSLTLGCSRLQPPRTTSMSTASKIRDRVAVVLPCVVDRYTANTQDYTDVALLTERRHKPIDDENRTDDDAK